MFRRLSFLFVLVVSACLLLPLPRQAEAADYWVYSIEDGGKKACLFWFR